MVKKLSCSKHYRFVATCDDCRVLNETGEKEENAETRRLYQEGNPDESRDPDIPDMTDRDDRGDRFYYRSPRTPQTKKKLMIGGGIFIVIILFIALYAIPLWHASISLQQQLYDSKSNIDFWKIYTLNFWSTRFFFNKIGLIGAILGALIMSLPPDRNIFLLLNQRLNWRLPSKKKTVLIWWTGGFILFFIIGQSMEKGYFALTIEMFTTGKIPFGEGAMLNALKAISNPANVSAIDVFVYQNVTHPILMFTLGLILFRLILSIVYNIYGEKDQITAAALGSFIIMIFFIMAILGRPFKAQNGIDLILVWSLYFATFIFLGIGIGLLVYRKKHPRQPFLPNLLQKKSITGMVVLVLLILLPVVISLPKTIGLNNKDVWTEVEWDVKIEKQIAWTREAAGIEVGGTPYFQTNDIYSYPGSATVPDATILDVIRQYDKQISGNLLNPLIKSLEQSMADIDIIYISSGTGQGEYWVAPKTLNTEIFTDSVTQHTEIYDHVNGFIALDTSTGEIVDPDDYVDIFGVDSQHSIFFGEKEDTSYTGEESAALFGESSFLSLEAYDNDILLYTGWANATGGFAGDPDGTLTGLKALWFTLGMGLTSYAFDSSFEKHYLINRNIETRVQSVLMPGMHIDDDSYLVFNKNESKMYYAVSIYTDLPIGAYSMSNLYRFLGVVLVDVQTGELKWYYTPQQTALSRDDALAPIWSIFTDSEYYPWQAAPSWLESQIRYPETLWEKQMALDYRYHVQDPTTWFVGTDFYKHPTGSDVYYVETDLGDGIEFVGVEVAEYSTEGAQKLAGLYIIRHGAHFGETIFYKVGGSDVLIGPETAENVLTTAASQRLAAITKRIGNKLLYPLAGSLYYYIPIYSQSASFEKLEVVGLVNAFDSTTAYGDNLNLAYADLLVQLDLNEPVIPTNQTSNLTLTVDASSQWDYDVDNWADFRVTVEYDEQALLQRNVTMNLTVWSDVETDVKVFNELKANFTYESAFGTANNYTIRTWEDATGLYPSETVSFDVSINPSDPLTGAGILIYYEFTLIDLDTNEIIGTGRQILTFLN
jgi:hypothetical protein